LVPFHTDDFYQELIVWAKKYQDKLGAKNRYLSFELVLLKNINDSRKESEDLINFLKCIGSCKVNLLIYNPFLRSEKNESEFISEKNALEFQNKIQSAGFVCTVRKSFGQDISGACGQLAGENVH